jgi:hypothetical protein
MSRVNCRQCNLVNFADELNCRRCGNDLVPRKESGSRNFALPGFFFSSIVKLLILSIIGGICYFGYSVYVEESGKVVQQQIRKKAEQERIQNAYVDSIKKEVKKVATPTP